MILSKPVVRADDQELFEEKIMILDASASMLTTTGGSIANDAGEEIDDTRFNRAVALMKNKVREVLEEPNGKVSIIVAGKNAALLTYGLPNDNGDYEQVPIQRADYTRLDYILDALEELLSPSANVCTYGNADIDGAMSIAEEILAINSKCELMLYSDTEYIDHGNVTLMFDEIRDPGEWNAGIINGTATLNSAYVYTFGVDIGCYGNPKAGLFVHFRVNKANSSLYNPNGLETYDVSFALSEFTEGNPVQHIEFNTWDYYNVGDDGEPLNPNDPTITDISDYSVVNYDSVQVYLSYSPEQMERMLNDDGFSSDNVYYFYGGQRPRLQVQYYSNKPNIYVNSIVASWRDSMSERFEIIPTEATKDTVKNEGFDVYIYEHIMPKELPDDGVVILLDPQETPNNAGFTVGKASELRSKEDPYYFRSGPAHSLTKNIAAEDIAVTQYVPLKQNGGGYEELMYCGNDTVLLFKNQTKQKIVVASINLNLATAPLLAGFSFMMTDLFDIFFPRVISGYLFEVGDMTTINSISDVMSLTIPAAGTESEITDEYSEFPFNLNLDKPGSYSISQYKINGTIKTNFFVKVPEKESNTLLVEDTLTQPYLENKPDPEPLDLLVYFAAALVALLFAEWWLQTRDQF